MTEANFWYDFKTEQKLSFNDEGLFLDEDGNKPKEGFQNNKEFAQWLHSYIRKRILQENFLELKIPNEEGAPIYHSQNALKSPDDLLVLIQGSGRVRVGEWSIGVCAYHGLKAGSVLSSIEEGKKRKMEVIVLNPNDKRSSLFGERFSKHIGMIKHTLAVFEDIIIPSNPKKVWIICHSMGGDCTYSVINQFQKWAMEHIVKIALTDACESEVEDQEEKFEEWYQGKLINWICSKEEGNTPLKTKGPCSTHRSAGTTDHALSTHYAFNFIWSFFDE